MYKQRSRRTGTAEDRRARYERRMEKERTKMVSSHGKAFAGSKRNKHLAANKRHSGKSDWYTLQVSGSSFDADAPLRPLTRGLMQSGDVIVDFGHEMKPNHQSRAISINDCFPPINQIMKTEDVGTMLDKINAKFGRKKSI